MKKNIFTFFFSLLFLNTFSIDSLSIKKRSIAVLDLTARNSESNDGELYSIKHILEVAGLPFIVTTNVNTAIKYGTVIPSSKILSSTFTAPERDSLIEYINIGGVLIATSVHDAYFYPLFGISSNNSSTSHHTISFDMSIADPSTRWLNDSMEQTISLGKLSYPTVIGTLDYDVSTAYKMARYEDSTTAITKNNYGVGFAYALGFSYKNLVLRNQINKDYEAQRIYSNGFEPTTDAVILFIKGIVTKHTPNTVWLHTSPYESKSTLMITHDVDATTAYDTMVYYSDYENSIGLSSTYLITTHYLDDGALSAFYNPTSIPQVLQLLSKGHKLASHSVGHFADFDSDSIVPIGVLGNTPSSYLPYNAGVGTPTIGATVLGETEVSKTVLQNDLGINIRSFRAGYLCYNDKLVNALDSVGYEYNSTYSACDVLTNFPYRNHKDRSSSGALTNVWEVPMTISDVFGADPISNLNYHDKQAIWLDVVNRNRDNYAPVVLLVHPTRVYKLWAQQDLINQLPQGVFTTDLETYADYWRGRDSINFTSELHSDTLLITIPSSQLPLNNMISFIVDDGQNLNFVKAQDEFGSPISISQSNWDNNGLILHFGYYSPLGVAWKENPYESGLLANCFPNPFTDNATLEIWFKEDANLNINIYNVLGQSVGSFSTEYLQAGIYKHNIESGNLPAGTYYCRINAGNKNIVKKLLLLQH
jgi:hypothetical protein